MDRRRMRRKDGARRLDAIRPRLSPTIARLALPMVANAPGRARSGPVSEGAEDGVVNRGGIPGRNAKDRPAVGSVCRKAALGESSRIHGARTNREETDTDGGLARRSGGRDHAALARVTPTVILGGGRPHGSRARPSAVTIFERAMAGSMEDSVDRSRPCHGPHGPTHE